jgi:spore germination protein YaaH
MAYDEHWRTSPIAGPNASLPWVRDAVERMLTHSPHELEQAIPPDRLILGLPFFNHIWRTVFDTGEVSHFQSRGTNVTRAFFEERNGDFTWDSHLGLYVGEASAFEDGETVIFRVWLECARSLQEKMHVFDEKNLAGVASWSRLFAIDEFWDVLEQYFD